MHNTVCREKDFHFSLLFFFSFTESETIYHAGKKIVFVTPIWKSVYRSCKWVQICLSVLQDAVTLCSYPFIFDAQAKTKMLQTDAELQMQVIILSSSFPALLLFSCLLRWCLQGKEFTGSDFVPRFIVSLVQESRVVGEAVCPWQTHCLVFLNFRKFGNIRIARCADSGSLNYIEEAVLFIFERPSVWIKVRTLLEELEGWKDREAFSLSGHLFAASAWQRSGGCQNLGVKIWLLLLSVSLACNHSAGGVSFWCSYFATFFCVFPTPQTVSCTLLLGGCLLCLGRTAGWWQLYCPEGQNLYEDNHLKAKKQYFCECWNGSLVSSGFLSQGHLSF